MNLWEKREVPRPPDYTLEYTKEDRGQISIGTCAQSLLDGIQKGHRVLDDKEISQCFQKEVGILTASLYRNGRHRTEKFYRVLRKVEKTCGRWQQLGMAEELTRLCHLMPPVIVPSRSFRLPSKQMFEYVLVRLLGGYHLMLHLDSVCKEAAALLMAKIRTGHFFSTAVAFLSVVARIRALALDCAGQVAEIYDEILPLVSHLKASKAPSLVDTVTLPSPLSNLLQQYCSSVDINRNPLPTGKHVTDTSFLNSLTKGEDSGNTSKADEFLGSPLCRNTTNKDSDNTKTKQSSKRLHTYAFNNLIDEDIGECVEQQTKPHKKNKVKKRKPELESCGNTESDVCGASKAAKMISRVDQPLLNSARMKPKKHLKISSGGKNESQSKISKAAKKLRDMEDHCSPSFIRLYKAVKKRTRTIDSVGNLRQFLQNEKKMRQKKAKERVSRLLKKENWSEFAKYIRKRIENVEGQSLDDPETVQRMIGKTRIRVKFWLLFPHLKGKKPENWTAILGTLAT